jgi:hypothetical protein
MTKKATNGPHKRTEKASADVHVGVVTNHKLGSGQHSAVFPSHGDHGSFHGGPRNGHPGAGTK